MAPIGIFSVTLKRKFFRAMRFSWYLIGSVFSERYALRLKVAMARREWDKEWSKGWSQEGYTHVLLRRALVIQATKAVYLPIPKCANTTMRHLLQTMKPSDTFLAEIKCSEAYRSFKRAFPGDVNFDDDGMLIRFYTPPGLAYLHDTEITLDELTSGSRRCFTIVRHPVKRFLSAWQNKVASPGNTFLKHALQEFYNREEGASFSIDDLIVYASEAPLQSMDIHVLPQWSCCGAGRIPFEMVGKVENLKQDIEALAEAGLIPKESVSRLGEYNVSGHSAGFDSLTQEQISTITAIYERDFEIFDY